MLNKAKWLGNRILERPSCTFWNGALWIAHLDVDQQVVVARIDVGDPTAPVSSQGLGITAPFGPAIAAHGSQLVLAVADPTQPLRLLTSTDGFTFAPAASPSLVAASAVALAAADWLWLAWVDEDRFLHVAHGNAYALSDAATAIRVNQGPALAAHDDLVAESLVCLAWGEGATGLVSAALFDETGFDPALPARVTLPDAGIGNTGLAFAPGHPGQSARVVIGFEREVPPGASSWDTRLFAREIAFDAAKVGGLQDMPHPGMGPGLARDPARIWACWRDMGARADELAVAPYDIVFDLPPELRELLDTECDPLLCPPDPRLVCAATDRVEWRFEPAWIRNARKGDLVVTPASGSGMIGGFLKTLQFEQHYDHMGIMLDDHRTVRHATMAHDRIEAFYSGSLFGEPAPTDGIRPDVIRYGWPGTITQSVQNGFMPEDGFNDGANPEWVDPTAADPGPAPPPTASDAERREYDEKKLRFRGFVDPEQVKDGKRVGYAFANLTWTPQLRSDGTVIEPVVVRPPPGVEAGDPQVRLTLHRVAEAARAIRGHYRFYAYTQGTIAGAPSMAGPPKGDPRWEGLPAGADWAAGSAAVVCSTFVWAAVGEASRRRRPQLWLEAGAEPGVEEQWRSQLEFIHDGLYRYHREERQAAAQALYDHVAAEARSQVWARMMKLKSKIGWVVTVVRWGAATVLTFLAMPLGALASLLGIRLENAQELVLGLNDMPDDLGNQMCNTFASDQAENKDGNLWKETGEGVSVAPHDVIHLWDPPTESSPRSRVGLWGDSERLMLPKPREERRRIHVFEPARGLAAVQGQLHYHGAAGPIVGAVVRIGCETALTDSDGRYRLQVAAARREIVAGTYWPQSKWWLEGRKLAWLEPGANPDHDIELEDPPEWRRVLQVRIKTDFVHQVAPGKDDWGHESTLLEHRFVHYPQDWGVPPSGAPPLVWDWHWTNENALLTSYAGDERVRLKLRATMTAATLAIAVELRAELVEDEEAEVEAGADATVTVQADGTRTANVSLKSGETPPDRAWLEITLLNMREMA